MWKEVFLGENVISSGQLVQNLFAVWVLWGLRWENEAAGIGCQNCENLGVLFPSYPIHCMAESSLLTPIQNYDVCCAVHAFRSRVCGWVEVTDNRTADFQGHLAHENLHSVILPLLPSVWEQSGISKPWHRLMRMNRLTQIPLSQWLDSTFTRQANQPKYCLFWMSKKISWLRAIVHLGVQ